MKVTYKDGRFIVRNADGETIATRPTLGEAVTEATRLASVGSDEYGEESDGGSPLDTLTADLDAQEEVGDAVSVAGTGITINADNGIDTAADQVKAARSVVALLGDAGVEVDPATIFPSNTQEVEFNPAMLEAMNRSPGQRRVVEANLAVGYVSTEAQAQATYNRAARALIENIGAIREYAEQPVYVDSGDYDEDGYYGECAECYEEFYDEYDEADHECEDYGD